MHAQPDELPLTPTTVMLPKPFAHAFPAIATQVQETLPILADAASRLMLTSMGDDSMDDEFITFALQSPTDFDLLRTGNNWARIVDLFRKAGFTFRIILSPEALTLNPQPSPEPIKPKAQKHNKLSGQAMVKLIDWMRNNVDSAKTDPDSKLATLASTALEMTVTVSNIASTREALGIAKIKPTAPPSVEERLARLEGVLGTLISWSVNELGETNALTLANILNGTLPCTFTPPTPTHGI